MPAQIRNFLAATDGSEGALRALDAAIAMAKAVGGTLHITTVGVALTAKEQEEFRRAEGSMADPSEVFGQRILEEARQRAERAGIKPSKTLLRFGDPTEAIIDTIGQEKVDVVIIGRRGRGRLEGLLLGSVSQKLASLAPCIVIVVP